MRPYCDEIQHKQLDQQAALPILVEVELIRKVVTDCLRHSKASCCRHPDQTFAEMCWCLLVLRALHQVPRPSVLQQLLRRLLLVASQGSAGDRGGLNPSRLM